MPIDLQRLVNSSFGINLASGLGRGLPPRLGYLLADFVARRLAAQRDSRLVQAVRANQWVVLGETARPETLDWLVYETIRHSARAVFDLYHYVQNPEATKRLIVLEPAARRLSHRPEFDTRGLVIVGLHLSNFDLVLQWMGKQGLRPLVLTIPDPQGGRRLEYEKRVGTGLTLLPASVGALRQALRHLQQGGMVLTGIDRPIPSPPLRPHFFGRRAALPLHHVYLAAKAKVPVVLMVTYLQADGKYHVLASDAIEMESCQDREMETLRNGEKVLRLAEQFILQAPQQWSVPLPVWPETVGLAPV